MPEVKSSNKKIVKQPIPTEESKGSLVYGNVYVNRIGQRAMLETTPNFPLYSVIIREKLTGFGKDEPELIVAMIKREKGFNSNSGDWQFLVFDSKASHIQYQDTQPNCISCHSKQQQQDFVFRDYLFGSLGKSALH